MKGNRCLTELDKALRENRSLLETLTIRRSALTGETMTWRSRVGMVERGICAQVASYRKSIYMGDTILQFIATISQHTVIYKRLRKILNDLHDELGFAFSTVQTLQRAQPRFAVDMFRAVSSNGRITYKMAEAFKEWYLICYSSSKDECFVLNFYYEGLTDIRSEIVTIQEEITLCYESVPFLPVRDNFFWTYPDESYPKKLDVLLQSISKIEKNTRRCHELWLKTQRSLGKILDLMDRILTQNADELDDNPYGIEMSEVIIEIVDAEQPAQAEQHIEPLFIANNDEDNSTVGSSTTSLTTEYVDSQYSEESN